ncbi:MULTISPECIES: aldehyde dehydrogenase [unclassified Rhizobium]|uniref:aldehyde dehydrogenase n=1 Tax=unclassified Rhizobium TaxID=2613769 RepID=UPI000715AEF9|nr:MULTISPECIES: aldehyde dehydrogenase [unclassified Rhizobium]KQS88040.1 aldehyde dehydrogenase [Rhizobium sp. Leaf386]KQS94404.1 aldehyde dehydrogenase [Rhizobium sp. Leaf391]KQU01409.1 aldehyde dehydrogenase [Rhizobium sp. Leaf453]
MAQHRNFIGGGFVYPSISTGIDVRNPATGEIFATVPAASDADVILAVAAAKKAQKSWGRLPAIERGDALRRLANALERHAPAIGEALAQESGKSLADATAEAIYGVELMRYHAEWARRIDGEVIESDTPNETLMLKREPIGVVACLIPFNFPIYTLVRKIAPALITGNAVVVRPSNTTPTSAFAFAQAVLEADLPAGLINIMTMSHETARTMCTQPSVGMITLTGSLSAGQTVLDYCKVNIAKPSLELGGKTPVIVEPDADLDLVARSIIAAKTAHCGQVCTSAERLYVHASVHDALVEKLRAGFAARRFGDRSGDPDLMGPLANAAARDRIHAMVERAKTEGATVEAGGVVPDGAGYFYPPTLLSGCRQDMEIVREEVFGPVLAVISYDTFEQALSLASDHQFGLASVLFSENYRKVMQAASEIEAGELYINRFPADPYQGYHAGWKKSGLGGDDGKHGMLEFTQTRLVILKH